MKSFGCRQFAIAATLLVAACCISCNHHTPTSTTPKSVKQGPEESIVPIMDLFRRRMEDTPIGFVMTDASGRSFMTGANKVSYELIQPANGGDSYKTVVTVESQSLYSIRRTVENSKDRARDKNKNGDEQKDKVLPDESEKDAVPVDSASPANTEGETSTSKSNSRPGEEAVARRPDVKVRKYDLIYEGGRWRLVTELNQETEQAIQNAFKNALDTQI